MMDPMETDPGPTPGYFWGLLNSVENPWNQDIQGDIWSSPMDKQCPSAAATETSDINEFLSLPNMRVSLDDSSETQNEAQSEPPVIRSVNEETGECSEQYEQNDERIIQPGGGSLYAKVHYLDNLQLDELPLSDRLFPRALLFSEDVIALAIRLDSTVSPLDGSREFGKSMLKRESDGCYSSHTLPSGYVAMVCAMNSTSAKRKGDQTIQPEAWAQKNIPINVYIGGSVYEEQFQKSG